MPGAYGATPAWRQTIPTKINALLVAAGLASVYRTCADHLTGNQGSAYLRSSRCHIGKLGLERGHYALTVLRKGGKIVTIPLARTVRAIDLAIGERLDGPDLPAT